MKCTVLRSTGSLRQHLGPELHSSLIVPSLGPQAAEALADPAAYPNLFPHLEEALHAEQLLGGC